MGLIRTLTSRGKEYFGRAETHDFQAYMAVNDIEHTKTNARSPQTNGTRERFHKTVHKSFTKWHSENKVYWDVEALQQDMDTWMSHYNHERTYQGKMCCGRTPWQRWVIESHIWREKVTKLKTGKEGLKIA